MKRLVLVCGTVVAFLLLATPTSFASQGKSEGKGKSDAPHGKSSQARHQQGNSGGPAADDDAAETRGKHAKRHGNGRTGNSSSNGDARSHAGGRSEEAHHHVIICHRTGSDSNPYVVINIPWTAWSEAHSPDTGAHPPLNGREDILLEDPAPGPGTKAGHSKDECEDQKGGGDTGGSDTGGNGGNGNGGNGGSSGNGGSGGGGGNGGSSGAGGTGGSGVAGTQASGGVLGTVGSAAETELPFTGLPIWIPLLAGAVLLFGGFLLRRRAGSAA